MMKTIAEGWAAQLEAREAAVGWLQAVVWGCCRQKFKGVSCGHDARHPKEAWFFFF